MRQSPEILAPAGSMEALTAAVHCGADAVYIGATLFSARQNAHNFDAAHFRINTKKQLISATPTV